MQPPLPGQQGLDLSDPRWWTLGISVIALMQPWLIGVWKKYVRRGRMRVYKTGFIEVGYGQFGPTIALRGTLRAADRDLFVTNISLIVTKIRDNSIHEFEWLSFRLSRAMLGQPQPTDIEFPSSFIVTTSNAH